MIALPSLGCRFRAAAEDAVRRRADDDLPYLYRVAFATLFDRLHVVILRILILCRCSRAYRLVKQCLLRRPAPP